MPILILLVFLFVEIMLFSSLADEIGFLGIIAEVFISAYLGVLLIRNAKNTLQKQVQVKSQIHGKNLIKFISGFFLFIPGIFTDILAGLIMVPYFNSFFSKIFSKTIKKDSKYTHFFYSKNNFYQKNNNEKNDIIDSEAIDIKIKDINEKN